MQELFQVQLPSTDASLKTHPTTFVLLKTWILRRSGLVVEIFFAGACGIISSSIIPVSEEGNYETNRSALTAQRYHQFLLRETGKKRCRQQSFSCSERTPHTV